MLKLKILNSKTTKEDICPDLGKPNRLEIHNVCKNIMFVISFIIIPISFNLQAQTVQFTEKTGLIKYVLGTMGQANC